MDLFFCSYKTDGLSWFENCVGEASIKINETSVVKISIFTKEDFDKFHSYTLVNLKGCHMFENVIF